MQKTGLIIKKLNETKLPGFFLILFLIISMLFPLLSHSEVLERIVAIVDDDVVLLSEYEKALGSARESDSEVSGETVINKMINRLILLRAAKKVRFGLDGEIPKDNELIIREYIDRRIKAFIHIPFDEIRSYYISNKTIFAGREFYDVKDEIEKYLIAEELVKRLREFIEERRMNSHIRIQMEDNPNSTDY